LSYCPLLLGLRFAPLRFARSRASPYVGPNAHSGLARRVPIRSVLAHLAHFTRSAHRPRSAPRASSITPGSLPRSARSARGAPTPRAPSLARYLVSLCGVCFRQKRQNLLNSSRSVVFFLFFVVL